MDKGKKTEVQEKVSIEMESYSHNEQFARVVTAVFVARMDPTIEELEDIKTAVSEAVTNCVIHAYEDTVGRILMELEVNGNELIVSVRDWGLGIADIAKAREPLYTSKETGDRSGMGFTFMETFMDKVEVISKPNEGTTVIMRKRIGNTQLVEQAG